ncbi:MAG: translation initiation factor IF-2 N-terminal domain-containing protein, partial [Proteobacteria bacterium]|nr:translation initiation factor IF-2 N-terminal domain-containing protein [Pseudomonadota bacterium]
MAKIRIYELARDFNMTNKALLEKIQEMDVPVKSHMSSLEDEIIEEIKRRILGKRVKTIEETRVKPTIIRRRKKHVRVEPVPVETAVEPDTQVEPGQVAEPPVKKPIEEKEAPATR